MLSSVLNSERAVKMSIAIIKAFVRLQQILATHKNPAHKLNVLESRVDKHDEMIQSIIVEHDGKFVYVQHDVQDGCTLKKDSDRTRSAVFLLSLSLAIRESPSSWCRENDDYV